VFAHISASIVPLTLNSTYGWLKWQKSWFWRLIWFFSMSFFSIGNTCKVILYGLVLVWFSFFPSFLSPTPRFVRYPLKKIISTLWFLFPLCLVLHLLIAFFFWKIISNWKLFSISSSFIVLSLRFSHHSLDCYFFIWDYL
jgi:hypothetical protein